MGERHTAASQARIFARALEDRASYKSRLWETLPGVAWRLSPELIDPRMKLQILFQGKSEHLSNKVQIPTMADFTIDGQVVLPAKGDRVTLRRLDSVDGAWLMCTGRRFDFNNDGEPVIYLGLQ